MSHILYLRSTLPALYLSIIVQMKMNLWCIPYLEIADDTYLVIDSIQLAIHINHLYVHFMTLTYAYKLIAWRPASYRESENNRKNIRRLRSACVQGFGVHFLGNYLMDYYQNEQIVRKQIATLKKNAQGNCDIVRDAFMRFTLKQPVSKK